MLIHQYDESAVGLEGSWEGREVPELINSNFPHEINLSMHKERSGCKKERQLSRAQGISKEEKCFGTSPCSPNTLHP